MAKITITIEDLPGNKVKVVSEPNFETMMKMHVSGAGLTSAHGLAFCALNAVREESKRRGPIRTSSKRRSRGANGFGKSRSRGSDAYAISYQREALSGTQVDVNVK